MQRRFTVWSGGCDTDTCQAVKFQLFKLEQLFTYLMFTLRLPSPLPTKASLSHCLKPHFISGMIMSYYCDRVTSLWTKYKHVCICCPYETSCNVSDPRPSAFPVMHPWWILGIILCGRQRDSFSVNWLVFATMRPKWGPLVPSSSLGNPTVRPNESCIYPGRLIVVDMRHTNANMSPLTGPRDINRKELLQASSEIIFSGKGNVGVVWGWGGTVNSQILSLFLTCRWI